MKRLLFLLLLLLIVGSTFVYAHETGEEHVELPEGLKKQIAYQEQLALGVTFLIALLAGLATFTSPCSFVIIPIYFSMIFKDKKKALLITSSFLLGLTIAFIIFGIIAGLVGNFFSNYKLLFASISGILLLIFGAMMILNKGFSIFTPKISENKRGIMSYTLFGFLFGVGWSPCIGPILSSIFFLAANLGSTLKSTLLLTTYATGIAIPLLLISLISDKTKVSNFFNNIKMMKFTIFKKIIITNWYNIIGGLIIITVGFFMFFFKGTTFIESLVTYVTGWVMVGFVGINDKIRELPFLSTNISSILGALISLIILSFIIFNVVRGIKSTPKKKNKLKKQN